MPQALIELLSEEIPARMQTRAAEDFRRLMLSALDEAGLTYDDAKTEAHAGPRRLTLVIEGLPPKQPDRREEKKGPREGAPQGAIEGFLKSAGLASLAQCELRDTGKGNFYFAVTEKKGAPTLQVLEDILLALLAKFPWPKSMVWSEGDFAWVRPLRNVLLVFDRETSVNLERKSQGRIPSFGSTYGHRLAGSEPITAIRDFKDYQEKLRNAHVLIDASERRVEILAYARYLADEKGFVFRQDEALLEEVAGLVEWPLALMGKIDERFMALPPEVLMTTMRVHQKYFALTDKEGKLAPYFIVIANRHPDNTPKPAQDNIIHGNERVLRARLADAEFFWDQDRRIPLADRLPALAEVTYHAKLGTLRDKARRIEALAAGIAETLQFSPTEIAETREAARLAKADLVSGMVGEFPELQGIMGDHYARAHGLSLEIAQAIGDHYKPLGSKDSLPGNALGQIVALADKIDTLIGFFSIGEQPTGSRDPFSLRRAALGIIRIILDGGLAVLDLKALFLAARHGYAGQAGFSGIAAEDVAAEAMAFLLDRLKVRLREGGTINDDGIRHDIVEAVFATLNESTGGAYALNIIDLRANALKALLAIEDGENLLIGLKRAANILRIEEKKDKTSYDGEVDSGLLKLPEEIALKVALDAAGPKIAAEMKNHDYEGAMRTISNLRAPIDAFFEKVTVNDAAAELRANRLRLLKRMTKIAAEIADFSRIEG